MTIRKISLALTLCACVVQGSLAADLPGLKDIPDMKEGLWESSTMMQGTLDKPMRTTICTSNAVTRKMYEDSHKNTDSPCKTGKSERVGSVITQDIECNFGNKVTHSKSITTVSGNTGMHIEMRDSDNKLESAIDMKWVSACPAGMKLGDLMGPDGKLMMNAMTP